MKMLLLTEHAEGQSDTGSGGAPSQVQAVPAATAAETTSGGEGENKTTEEEPSNSTVAATPNAQPSPSTATAPVPPPPKDTPPTETTTANAVPGKFHIMIPNVGGPLLAVHGSPLSPGGSFRVGPLNKDAMQFTAGDASDVLKEVRMLCPRAEAAPVP